jgi:hypothetical protein
MTKSQGRLTLKQIRRIVERIEYLDWTISVNLVYQDPEGAIYLQVSFDAWDETTGKYQVQDGRKWLVSRYSTTSEIVQTALKAVLAAQEHEVREGFRYRGKAIFGPHFDVDDLADRLPDLDTRSPITDTKASSDYEDAVDDLRYQWRRLLRTIMRWKR